MTGSSDVFNDVVTWYCVKLQIVSYYIELDPFDGNDGDVTLHHEEVHGPSVSFLTSDDDDDNDEHYGM